MTIRFAACAGALAPRLDRSGVRAVIARPVNDNGSHTASDALLETALRYFALHGMAAASRARDRAEAAFSAGDRPTFLKWLEICRVLDRTMAREINLTGQDRE